MSLVEPLGKGSNVQPRLLLPAVPNKSKNFTHHSGVTTIVDMPLNSSPVTVNVSALNEKIKSTQDKIWVDVALLGGIVPSNADDIVPLIQVRCHEICADLCRPVL